MILQHQDGAGPNSTGPDGTGPDSTSPNGTSPNGTSRNGTSPDGRPRLAVVSVFAEVNERIRELASRDGGDGPREFVCECTDGRCAELVSLTLSQYDALRSQKTRVLAHG